MYILETNSFKYYLGERLLFKLPALKLHTKSRIGLIGLNGSGKTTLLELLAGIRPIDKKPLWQTVSFSVKSGDKLAIIGPNGCGKTTLLKQFLKAQNKHLPNVQIAGGAKIGYFSQDIDILDPDKNLLRNLQSTSSQSEALLRTVLIRLRFKREDFF